MVISLDPNKYMLKNVADFKRRANDFNRNLRYAALIYILLFITIYIDSVVYPPQTYATPGIAGICSLIFIILALKLSKKKPSFKEYLLYYFWMGKDYLDKYHNKGASDKDLKNAISFFKKLDYNLVQSSSFENRHKFDTEEAMYKSIDWLEKWIDKFVYKSLKKGKTDIYPTVDKVFNESFKYLLDEDFNRLNNFLQPYVQDYVKKSKYPIVNFFYWLHSSYKRCLFFYGGAAVCIIVGLCYAIYINYGIETVFGVFTVASVVLFTIGMIISYFNKKFTPHKK